VSRLRAWSLALGAGAIAASADVAAHATGAPHVVATLGGAALFFAVGRWTRGASTAWLAPAVAGAGLHGALDAVWMSRALHLQLTASLPVVGLAAAFDLATGVLAAFAGARSRR
jgi:hypothetical protein